MFNLEKFSNPPAEYKGTDFWMLNDALSDDDIDFQLSEMKKQSIASFIARTYIGLKSDYPGPDYIETAISVAFVVRHRLKIQV